MHGAIKRFNQFIMLAEHLLPGDIDKADAGLHGTGLGQHGDTCSQWPPKHNSSRDAEIMLSDHLRLFQWQADHLLEGLLDICIATDIVPT